MQLILNRYRVAILHASFWCVYMSFTLYQMSVHVERHQSDWGNAMVLFSVQLISTLLIVYINYFFLLPRWLKNKTFIRYSVEFLLFFALIMFVRVHLVRYVIDGYSYNERYFYSTLFIVQLVGITLFIVIFVSMLKFAVGWFELEAKRRDVENEKLTAELNFLKAQINPHFLFNTLNNLYYLAYSKSSNTTEVIAKLSQMMRYMIYDSNHQTVLLSKEIEYMENYISLEKLRLNNQIPIKLDVKGNPQEVMIVPLIFITFLENAFKHGVTNNYEGSWINISINIMGQECVYSVENSKVKAAKMINGNKSGIGLKNVQRRLELSYPGQHQMYVEDHEDRYSVRLNIKLK